MFRHLHRIIILALFLTSAPSFAQSLSDVLCSIQERKQAIEQSKQLVEHLKNLNGLNLPIPPQELIEWNGLGTNHFPSDSDLSATGIDARIALLNQAIKEFRTIQRSYINIREQDLVNDAKLGAMRPYMREDFVDPGRVDASNYHAILAQMAVQVLRLRVLEWPTAAKYNYHSYEVLKSEDDQGTVTYAEDSSQVEGFQPAMIGPMAKAEEDSAFWALTDPAGFLIELIDTENYASDIEDPNPEEDGDTVKSLHCWMSGQLMSKAKLATKVPGQDANTQLGAKVALIARSAWTPALEADYTAPEPWKNTNAAYTVVTSATDSTEDIDIPSPTASITLNLTWHGNEYSQGNLSGYEEWWTGVENCWANYYNNSYNMSLQIQLHRHVMAVAAPTFTKGLNASGKAAYITKTTKASASTPGDAMPILHPSPGILLGIPIGTGLDGGQPAWIGWAPGDTLFHTDAPCEFAGQLDENEDPFADQFANTLLSPFQVQGPRQIRFDHASNLRFIGAAQDFHVVYETSRAARGAGLPALAPTDTEKENSGWNGDYDRESEHFLWGQDIDVFWKNQFFSAWEAPRLRQVVSRDFIIDITHTGHYAHTIKIYRRSADALEVVRTPGTLATPDPANLIRTLVCSNPDAGDDAYPAVAEKIVMMEGTTKYEVWKDGIEADYAKNSHPLRFQLTEGETVRWAKVIDFPETLDARITTTVDGAPSNVEEITGSWPVINLDHLYPQIADREIGWNWWDHRASLSWKRTAGSQITQITNTIDESQLGSQKGAWPATSEITVTSEPDTNLAWNTSGRITSWEQGSWKTEYSIESEALKAESKFSNSTFATTWTEWSDNDRTIKTYTAPDGSVTSKTSNDTDWSELTLGNTSGTGLPGLPHSLTRKDGTETGWTWNVGNDHAGSLTVESDTQTQTTAWNNRNYIISSQTAFISNGTVTVANHEVPSGQSTPWGAPMEWKNLLTNLAGVVAYEPGLNRPSSMTSPLGLTTAFSGYDIFNRPGQVVSNGITANNSYSALSTNSTYSGTGVESGSQSTYSTNIEGTDVETGLTWGGVTQSRDIVRDASSTTVTGSHSLLGASAASLRNSDGTTAAANDATLAFGGVSGDALSVAGGLLVTKSAVAGQTNSFAETHTDAWGRTRKIVTPSKSGSGNTQTTFDFNLPASAIKRVITTEPSGRVYITESEANGTITRSGIDVNGNGSLGTSDRYTQNTKTVDNGKVVTTLSVTEDTGLREVLESEWTPSSGVTVTKINGNEETITTTPNYAAKTIPTSSDKGWSRTAAINNIGLATSNTLSGTGIPTTDLKPVWRADGSLASVELDIVTGPNNEKETHTASFNPDGTLASLTAPGRGNILGGHSISNGVESLTVDGVTMQRALDGTSQSISGANVIGRSEALTTSGGGYKNTTTPAVGSATDTFFNAASAPTGKTYADSSGHSINYAGELPYEITLARGGAVTLGYSNDGAKDLTSAVWPAVASGPFTIPSVGVGFGYNQSGNINSLSDPSGTRVIHFQNGRVSGTTYTAGLLKGYEIIPGRDTLGRHTGTLVKRFGTTIHSTAKAPNGVSNQITNLASGNITATPQRDGAGRIIGYTWSDGTGSVTQTWARGPGGRINSAGSNVPGAPSFTHTFDASGRRATSTTAGDTWTYTYGTGGQLTSATHPSLGSFNYAFDGIGRRTDKGEANASDILNRTTAWTNNQNKTITIKAHPDARVWFNGVEIENFTGTHNAAVTPPGTEGGWVAWETLAILEGAGEGAGNPAPNPLASPDAKAEKKGAVWVPPTNVQITYDAAGNRESSAQWNFGWDAKNQLTRARTKNHTTAPQAYDLTFSYDSEGRRVKKHVVEYQNGTQVSEKIVTFVWDGWDLLYERHQLPSGLTTIERKYLWGPSPISYSANATRTMEAGGLLLIQETKGNTTSEIIPLYDGSGNIIGLTNLQNELLATYVFGPYGERAEATGPLAQSNPWRWSTKYLDEETGLYYFGHRYQDPTTGQFLSREPLGEGVSPNLYLYGDGDPINKLDELGLKSKWVTDPNNPIKELPDGRKVINLVWLVDKWFGDDYLDYSKTDTRAFGTNYWDHYLWSKRADGSWGTSAGNQTMLEVAKILEEKHHFSTHAKIGTVAMGGYSALLAAPAVAVTAPAFAGAASEASLAVGVRGMTYATQYSGALARIGAVGTGGLVYSGLHDPDSVGMMLSTPSPADDIAGGLRGFGLLAKDARAAGAAAWQWVKPGMGNALEAYLYRSGSFSYAVSPGQVPDDFEAQLEAQLIKLYDEGLKKQSLLQNMPLPTISLMPKFPGAIMIETANLRAFPGGRGTYSPDKLLNQRAFDWSKFTHPIEVQYVNGVPYVMNGMTRIENARRAGITRLPAYILSE